MIKDDNYYTVFYWFIHDLGLKGAELPIFAIIYSFSQDGASSFSGSQSYLADFAGCSRRTAITTIQSLIEKGFINQIKKNNNAISYQVNIDYVKKFHKGCEEISQGVVKKFHKGCEEISHNKQVDNKEDNTTSIIKEINKEISICYSDDELKEIYPFNNSNLTVAQMDYLSKVIVDYRLDAYCAKVVIYDCKSRFETIIKWAIEDGCFNEKGANNGL